MKKSLSEAKFDEMKDRSFDLYRVVEMMCEVCEKPMRANERLLRTVQIASKEDFERLLSRGATHDRAEIDIEGGKIYFYDHDFPGDVHAVCVEKL